MENSKSRRLVIACMDRRLNKFLDDKFNDGNTIFIRNAGANAFCIKDDIVELVKRERIDSIHIVAHTDCKAMLIVHDALAEHKHFSKRITKNLVSCFKGMKAVDRESLERNDEKVQADALKGMVANGVKITTELVDISKLGVPASHDEEHFLVMARPTTDSYRAMCEMSKLPIDMTYFIQATDPRHAEHDMEIALVMLHIKNVRLFEMSGTDEGTIAKEIEMLEQEERVGNKKK